MIETGDTKNPFKSARIVGSGIDPNVYHCSVVKRGDKDFVMSRSELMEFQHCPSRWIKGFVGKDSAATEWGSIMDCLFLEPTKFNARFAVSPAFYPGKDGEKPWTYQANYCKEWRDNEVKNGRSVLKCEDHHDAMEAVAVLGSDETISELVNSGDTQVFVMAEYEDADTGIVIPVKALIDLVPDVNCPKFGKTLIDFKTANSAAPGPWQNAVNEHGYHVQAALYLDAYTAATGEDRVDFFHIIQESYPPWEIGRRFLSSEFITLGRMRYTDALERYARCLATNEWPSYDADPVGLSIHGFTVTEPKPWMINP